LDQQNAFERGTSSSHIAVAYLGQGLPKIQIGLVGIRQNLLVSHPWAISEPVELKRLIGGPLDLTSGLDLAFDLVRTFFGPGLLAKRWRSSKRGEDQSRRKNDELSTPANTQRHPL